MGETQSLIDRLTEESVKKGGALFEEMLQPILSLIDKTDDIRVLQEQMKSPAALKDLYREMESAKLDDLIRQGIYLSELVGRAAEDG